MNQEYSIPDDQDVANELPPEIMQSNETIARFIDSTLLTRDSRSAVEYINQAMSIKPSEDQELQEMHSSLRTVLESEEINVDDDEVVCVLVEFCIKTQKSRSEAANLAELRRAARNLLALRMVEQSYDDNTIARWRDILRKTGIYQVLAAETGQTA